MFNTVFLIVVIGGFFCFFRYMLKYNKTPVRIIRTNGAISRADISTELRATAERWEELEYATRIEEVTFWADWAHNKAHELKEELSIYLTPDESDFIVPVHEREKVLLLSFFEEVEKLFLPPVQAADKDMFDVYDEYINLWNAFIPDIPKKILNTP